MPHDGVLTQPRYSRRQLRQEASLACGRTQPTLGKPWPASRYDCKPRLSIVPRKGGEPIRLADPTQGPSSLTARTISIGSC
jgi:hypothetical protein